MTRTFKNVLWVTAAALSLLVAMGVRAAGRWFYPAVHESGAAASRWERRAWAARVGRLIANAQINLAIT
jgi:hypothetical protein